jgi:hypothetical protein
MDVRQTERLRLLVAGQAGQVVHKSLLVKGRVLFGRSRRRQVVVLVRRNRRRRGHADLDHLQRRVFGRVRCRCRRAGDSVGGRTTAAAGRGRGGGNIQGNVGSERTRKYRFNFAEEQGLILVLMCSLL